MSTEWPDWLEGIWQQEATGHTDPAAITAEAEYSLTDLTRLAILTADPTVDSWTAATTLFGDPR